MTVKQLQAELTKNNVEFDKEAKKAELEKLVLELHGVDSGMPHLVTAEDLELNPELVGEVAVGDVIIIPDETEGVASADLGVAPATPEEIAAKEAAEAAAIAAAGEPPQPQVAPTAPVEPAPEVAPEPTLKETYDVVTGIKYDGVRYAPGETVSNVDDKVALQLLKAGAIR